MPEVLTTAGALASFRKELIEREMPDELVDYLTREFLPILANDFGVAVRDA